VVARRAAAQEHSRLANGGFVAKKLFGPPGARGLGELVPLLDRSRGDDPQGRPTVRYLFAAGAPHRPHSSRRVDAFAGIIGAQRIRFVRKGTSEGGMAMSAIRASRPTEDGPTLTTEVEAEIRGLPPKEFASARWPLPVAARLPLPVVERDDREAGPANSLIQRVAGASMLEIEKLVDELQGLREFLRSEVDRVQREITGYARVSDAAMKSTQIIADSVSQWKSAIEGERTERV
jgi:hypothetical protein